MIVQSRHPSHNSSPRHTHPSNQPQGNSNKSIAQTSALSPTSTADVVTATGGEQYFDKLSCRLDSGSVGAGNPPFVMKTSSAVKNKEATSSGDGTDHELSSASGLGNSSTISSIRKVSSISSFPGNSSGAGGCSFTTSNGIVLQGTNNSSLLQQVTNAVDGTISSPKGGEAEEEPLPKRPLSAYNYFFKSERARLLGIDEEEEDLDADHEEGDETSESGGGHGKGKGSNNSRRKHRKVHGKITFRDMANQVGSKWKTLSDEEKKPYVAKFEADRQRYREEMAQWTERQKEIKKKRKQEEQQMKKALKAQQKKEKQMLREQHLLFLKQQKEMQLATSVANEKKRKQREMQEQRSETEFHDGAAVGPYQQYPNSQGLGVLKSRTSRAKSSESANVPMAINGHGRANSARGLASRDLFEMSTNNFSHTSYNSGGGTTTKVRVGDAKAAAAPMFDAYRSLLLPENHGSINSNRPCRSRSVAVSSRTQDANASCSMLPHPSGDVPIGGSTRMLRRANTIGSIPEKKTGGGAVYDIFQDLSTSEQPEEDEEEEVDEAIDQALSILQKDEGNLQDDIMQKPRRHTSVATAATAPVTVAHPPETSYTRHPDRVVVNQGHAHRNESRRYAPVEFHTEPPLPAQFSQAKALQASSHAPVIQEERMSFPHAAQAQNSVAVPRQQYSQQGGMETLEKTSAQSMDEDHYSGGEKLRDSTGAATALVASSAEPKKKKRRKAQPHRELVDNKELDSSLMDFWNSMAGGEDSPAAAAAAPPLPNITEKNEETVLPDGLVLDAEGLMSGNDKDGVLPMPVDFQGAASENVNLDTVMDLDLNLDLNLGDDTLTTANGAASGEDGSSGYVLDSVNASRGPPVPMMEEGEFDKFLEEFDYSTDDENNDAITAQVQELQGCLMNDDEKMSSEEGKKQEDTSNAEIKDASVSQVETKELTPDKAKDLNKVEAVKLEDPVGNEQSKETITNKEKDSIECVAENDGNVESADTGRAESKEEEMHSDATDNGKPPRQVSEEALTLPQAQQDNPHDGGEEFTPTSRRVAAAAVSGIGQMPRFPKVHDLHEDQQPGEEEDVLLMLNDELQEQQRKQQDRIKSPYGATFQEPDGRRARSMPNHSSMMSTVNENNEDDMLMKVQQEFLDEPEQQKGSAPALFDPLAMYGSTKSSSEDSQNTKDTKKASAPIPSTDKSRRLSQQNKESNVAPASQLFDPTAFLSSASTRKKSPSLPSQGRAEAQDRILFSEGHSETPALQPSPRTPSHRRPMMTAAGTLSKGNSPAGRSVASAQSRRSQLSAGGHRSPHSATRSLARTPEEEEMMLREREAAMLRNMRRQQQQQFMVIQQQQQIMAQMQQMMVMNNIDPGPLPSEDGDDDLETANKNGSGGISLDGSGTKKGGSRASKMPSKKASSPLPSMDVDGATNGADVTSQELSHQIQESRQKMRMIQEQHAKLQAAIMKGGGRGGRPQRMQSEPALHRLGGEDGGTTLEMQRRVQAQKLKQRHVQLQQQMMQMQMMKHQQRELRKQQQQAAAAAATSATARHPGEAIANSSSSKALNDLEATLQRLMPRSRRQGQRASASKSPRPMSTSTQQAQMEHYGEHGDVVSMGMEGQMTDVQNIEISSSSRNHAPKTKSGNSSRSSQKLNGTTSATRAKSSKEAWNAICAIDTLTSSSSNKPNSNRQSRKGPGQYAKANAYNNDGNETQVKKHGGQLESQENITFTTEDGRARAMKEDEVAMVKQESRHLSYERQDVNRDISEGNNYHNLGEQQTPEHVASSAFLKTGSNLATTGAAGVLKGGSTHADGISEEVEDLSNVDKFFFA